MSQPTPDPVVAIDRKIRASIANRESARREIRRLSGVIIAETKNIDALLAERSTESIRADIARLEAAP